ncbi:MAG TPA: sigma-70 family RNA polymerase sigma factor [Solirubrobacteraceae bacterium]|jgi:RNA polymerase sigma-70 factor (ECF subfamily)|nr:sigma-70 family RNA polymerase sigma factor [Solirubrobacteraceae bacterium]
MGLTSEDISQLYARHAQDILCYCARRTLQAEIAVELVGETFAEAFVHRADFRGDGEHSAIAWIYAIARGRLADYFRRGQVHRRALERLGVTPPDLLESDYERIEELAALASLRGQLADGLAALSAGHRDALRLRIVEERAYPDVARELGVSEQTARARVSRALRVLRRDIVGIEGVADHA